MTRAKYKQAGFTTIEIIIVLIVIVLLSGVILATRKGIDAKQDNTERKRDIDELRVGLESYYSQYNKYPTLAQVNNASWRALNMKGLNRQVLRDPNSTRYSLAASPAKNVYAYKVSATSGRACDDAKVICTEYTLTATLTGGGTYVENNLD